MTLHSCDTAFFYQKMCEDPRYPVCSREPRLVETVAPSKATKRDTIKVETLKLSAAPLRCSLSILLSAALRPTQSISAAVPRLAVVVAFPLRQANDVRLLTMMWDNIDFYPCSLPATRKFNIDFVLYGTRASIHCSCSLLCLCC